MTDWVDEILAAKETRGQGGVLAESAEGEKGRMENENEAIY